MDLGDYLAEEGQAEMVWTGKDAGRLRLQGTCRQADFELRCKGEDPRTRMRLMLRACLVVAAIGRTALIQRQMPR
jgi:hypothetical protein